ncbi:glycosyltransferase [Gammaproteobacteria bacterium]|nr:glycosyltransferase [Gammaproteobacteria bacterium]
MDSEHPNKRRIVHLCKVFRIERGGVQAVIQRLSSLFSDRYDTCVVSTNHSDKSMEEDGLKLIEVRSHGSYFSMPLAPTFPQVAWKAMRESDVVVGHYPFPMVDLSIALAPFRLPRTVVVWHSNIVEQRLSRWVVAPLTFLMLLRASRIVVAAPPIREHSGFLRLFAGKVSEVSFPNDPQAESCLRDAIDYGDDGYFLFVGRHVRYKGIDVLIRAASRAGVRVKLAGSGPLFDRHKQLALSLDPSGELIEFLGEVENEALQHLYRRCKALVLPSISPNEALGLVQMEAMARGKPVINTGLDSGVPWVARHGIEGVTVEPGDEAGLETALRDTRDEAWQRYGRNARQRAASVFSSGKAKRDFSLVFDGG